MTDLPARIEYREAPANAWDKLTEGHHGFAWGPVEVVRAAVIRDHGFLLVTTDTGDEIEIKVSPTGKSLRVFKNGKEMKA